MSTRNQKPRIFIASAVESLDVADAVNFNLDHDASEISYRNTRTFRVISRGVFLESHF